MFMTYNINNITKLNFVYFYYIYFCWQLSTYPYKIYKELTKIIYFIFTFLKDNVQCNMLSGFDSLYLRIKLLSSTVFWCLQY